MRSVNGLHHVTAIAAREGVPLLDLDDSLDLPRSAFYDTHHVNTSAVDTVSRHFARGLLAVAPR